MMVSIFPRNNFVWGAVTFKKSEIISSVKLGKSHFPNVGHSTRLVHDLSIVTSVNVPSIILDYDSYIVINLVERLISFQFEGQLWMSTYNQG